MQETKEKNFEKAETEKARRKIRGEHHDEEEKTKEAKGGGGNGREENIGG